ncbi:MAG: hypothetical protein J6C59_09485 [Muribaculaceae bacterium]|nr:hypothetical protein [Muribaculaceae bacterium]
MKQYTITQHPFKITFEIDDEWLNRYTEITEADMQEMADNCDKEYKKIAVALHALAAQQDASEKMNSKPKPYPELPE